MRYSVGMNVENIGNVDRIGALFWDKVEKTDGCWVWKRSVNKGGYGQFAYWNGEKTRSILAHRMAWLLATGALPDEPHAHILHHCDNKICVRPDHLFLGDDRDNMQDLLKKGRFPSRKGERNGRAKLTEEDVRAIHTALACRARVAAIAAHYNVSVSTIIHIERGIIWPDLLPNTE